MIFIGISANELFGSKNGPRSDEKAVKFFDTWPRRQMTGKQKRLFFQMDGHLGTVLAYISASGRVIRLMAMIAPEQGANKEAR